MTAKRVNAFAVKEWCWDPVSEAYIRQHSMTGVRLACVYESQSAAGCSWLMIAPGNYTPENLIVSGDEPGPRDVMGEGFVDLWDALATVDAMLLEMGWTL